MKFSDRAAAAFSLVELLVVIAITAVLLSVLLPSLAAAREQARAAVCASNLRQIAIANIGYSGENGGRLCPGAPRIKTENRRRWHGVRNATTQAFDGARGPLVPYLGPEAAIRACASLHSVVASGPAAFEKAAGGYGYNQAYLGRLIQRPSLTSSYKVVSDLLGLQLEHVRRPADTVLFTDAAIAAVAGGVVEYSFVEPRFHPEFIRQKSRPDPSIHFRHARRANVAWTDGHLDRRARTRSQPSAVYEGDPVAAGLGWFGMVDDNGLFDFE